MDLLLTHGYFLNEDAKELQIMKPYAPLGILYLCSHLRQKGFDVEVFDSTFSTREELYKVLRTETPAILGIYANLMTRKHVVEILRAARELGWICVVGGPEPGAYPKEYLECGAHIVVNGEGEVTMEELLPILLRRDFESLRHIAGIAFLDEGEAVRITGPRAQLRDLDAQPLPARGDIAMSKYLSAWRTAHGKSSVSLITARGCPYRCRWCSHQVYGQTHRRRNPVLVVDEIECLISEYQPDMMWIADDVFTIHHAWLRTYASEMRQRNLHIPFECITRADRMNSEVAELMATLGCFRIWIGSESGSQRVLDAMQRDVTTSEVQTAVELCRERGIQTGMFLMWGYEGEDLSDIEATLEHLKRTDPDIFFTTVAYPIKGTPYYEEVKDRLTQVKPWAETSDREITLRGRHPRSYYETADSLLRDEMALQRASRVAETSPEFAHDLEARINSARRFLRDAQREAQG
ncbi:MAG TPA: radical SAM protein [Terriglobales bacterium]|nr:radical SAM protein [Terriglobales bacterium]